MAALLTKLFQGTRDAAGNAMWAAFLVEERKAMIAIIDNLTRATSQVDIATGLVPTLVSFWVAGRTQFEQYVWFIKVYTGTN